MGPKESDIILVNCNNFIRNIQFNINRTTSIKRLKNSYCKNENKNIDNIRLIYKGIEIDECNTPDSLNMKNGDIVHVIEIIGSNNSPYYEDQNINLTIIGYGKPYQFNIKKTTIFKKIKETYCKKENINLQLMNVKFLYDLDEIDDDDTPELLKLTDGKIIYAMIGPILNNNENNYSNKVHDGVNKNSDTNKVVKNNDNRVLDKINKNNNTNKVNKNNENRVQGKINKHNNNSTVVNNNENKVQDEINKSNDTNNSKIQNDLNVIKGKVCNIKEILKINKLKEERNYHDDFMKTLDDDNYNYFMDTYESELEDEKICKDQEIKIQNNIHVNEDINNNNSVNTISRSNGTIFREDCNKNLNLDKRIFDEISKIIREEILKQKASSEYLKKHETDVSNENNTYESFSISNENTETQENPVSKELAPQENLLVQKKRALYENTIIKENPIPKELVAEENDFAFNKKIINDKNTKYQENIVSKELTPKENLFVPKKRVLYKNTNIQGNTISRELVPEEKGCPFNKRIINDKISTNDQENLVSKELTPKENLFVPKKRALYGNTNIQENTISEELVTEEKGCSFNKRIMNDKNTKDQENLVSKESPLKENLFVPKKRALFGNTKTQENPISNELVTGENDFPFNKRIMNGKNTKDLGNRVSKELAPQENLFVQKKRAFYENTNIQENPISNELVTEENDFPFNKRIMNDKHTKTQEQESPVSKELTPKENMFVPKKKTSYENTNIQENLISRELFTEKKYINFNKRVIDDKNTEADENTVSKKMKIVDDSNKNNDNKISIKIKEDNKYIIFKVNKKLPFRKLKNVYCKRANLDPRSIILFFDKIKLGDRVTPEFMNMQNGDVIDIIAYAESG